MIIELNPHTEALVTELVSRGRYTSPEQAATAAFELLEQALDEPEEAKPGDELSLVELFGNSPFAKFEIELEQNREPWKPLDL